MNSVRSPMAAAIMRHLFGKFVYVDSAGARAGELDPFAVEVMDEIGIEIGKHHPKTLRRAGRHLRSISCITLSPEAQHRAMELDPHLGGRDRILADHGPDAGRGLARASGWMPTARSGTNLKRRIQAAFRRPTGHRIPD